MSCMDKRRCISVLKTFSKTFEANEGVPIASLMAFNASASFFNSAISSTTLLARATNAMGSCVSVLGLGWVGVTV